LGGLNIAAYGEDAVFTTVLQFSAQGGTASTSKSNAGAVGLVNFSIAEHNGSGALANITPDGNVFAIRAQVDGAMVTRMMVDEDGQMHLTNTTLVALTDEINDRHIVRGFEMVRARNGADGYVQSRWDEFVTIHEPELVDMKILGAPVKEGGMWNISRHVMALNGAVWQNYEDIMVIKEGYETRINQLEMQVQKLLAA
jgi:hypothetical protein